MAETQALKDLMNNERYSLGSSIDFQVTAPIASLFELLDAPNHDVEYLGEVALKLVRLPEGFEHIEFGEELTMKFVHVSRHVDIDNQVITPTTSWYRDNNRTDNLGGRGTLIVPETIVEEPGVITSKDGTILALPSHASLSCYNSTYQNESQEEITGRLSLLRLRLRPETD